MDLLKKYLAQYRPRELPLADKLPTGLELTKLDAAINQIMAAIEMLLRGRYECAITLAGAAEGMLPRTPQSLHALHLEAPLPDELVDHEFAAFTRSQRNAFLNRERDWLKHANPSHPASVTIGRIDAESMIVRALSELPEVDFAPEHEALLRTFFALWFHDLDWKPPAR